MSERQGDKAVVRNKSPPTERERGKTAQRSQKQHGDLWACLELARPRAGKRAGAQRLCVRA